MAVSVRGTVRKSNASGLGVVTDVTALNIQSGDRVFCLMRKEPNTPTLAQLAASNPWGTYARTFTLVTNSRVEQANATTHSLCLLARTATEAETEYTINWASGNGGRTELIYFVLDGLAGSADVETIATAASTVTGTSPTLSAATTSWVGELIVNAVAKSATTDDWTPDTDWTTLFSVTDQNLYGQYRTFGAAGTDTGEMSPTANVASHWTALAVRFKPAAVASTSRRRRRGRLSRIPTLRRFGR